MWAYKVELPNAHVLKKAHKNIEKGSEPESYLKKICIEFCLIENILYGVGGVVSNANVLMKAKIK